MEGRLIITILYLLKDIIISPNSVFKNIKNGNILKEVYTVFCIGSFITFSKTFLINKQTITVFTDENLNKMLSLLSIPQVSWLILYAGYFLFLLCIFALCKFFNRQAKLKSLVLSLMSISGIGVNMQILFYVFQFIFPKEFILVSFYLIYFWVVILSLLAIKTTQSISFLKAVVCFFISAIPFMIFILPIGISPYLAWLNV